MITLTVSGDKPEEFYASFAKTAKLLLLGVAKPAVSDPATTDPEAQKEADQRARLDMLKKDAAAEPVAEETIVETLANPSATEAPPEEQPVKKRGRPAKVTTIDAEPVKPATVHNDPIPDFLGEEEKKPAEAKTETRTYTVEDCREQLRLVFTNFEQRARAAKADYKTLKGPDLIEFEGKVMRDKVEYAKRLFAEFGTVKLSELKPEQFGSFVAAAAPYVTGEA